MTKDEAQALVDNLNKAPPKTSKETALGRFKTLKPDDERWTSPSAQIVGDCYVFCETESFRIFPFSQKLGCVVPLKIEWALVHVMHSARVRPTSFKVYRHQGMWRYAASSWVMLEGAKMDFGPPPLKRPGEVVPFMGQRTEMVKSFAAVLGIAIPEASKLFGRLTGQ